jgi:hypothetical protein
MAYAALSPVSAAIFATLNVAGLTALVGSRLYDNLPPNPTFPCVLFTVRDRRIGSMGAASGGPDEIELRVYVYSASESTKDAQTITQKVRELLRDKALTVTGYTQGGRVVWESTLEPTPEEITGVRVLEQVSLFRLWMVEA